MNYIENLRFSEILVIATCLCGFIWSVDTLLFKHRRMLQLFTHNAGNSKIKEPFLVDYAKSFFPILLLVLIIRSFIVEPFRIPSSSMVPTLLIGDFILVNKYDYGLKLPLLKPKLFDIGAPKRGDVIVFRHSADKDFIKRVVGIPGDKISYKDKTLTINGSPVKLKFEQEYSWHETNQAVGVAVRRYQENLGNQPHAILIYPEILAHNVETNYTFYDDITVPINSYFVLGDNRDASQDSRFWGFVKEENIIGRAFFIWMSWNNIKHNIRLDRIMTKIQ